jgi:hypothetical protein
MRPPLKTTKNTIMKQLLTKIIACAAILLPISAGATTYEPFRAKTYGGWEPGKTFTFTVKTRTIAKGSLNGVKTSKVPKGIPSFKKGDKIKFVIGKKGQLTVPKKFSLPFKADGGTVNEYYIAPDKDRPQGDIGQIYKNSKDKPLGGFLTFSKFVYEGFNTTAYLVNYSFE